MRCSFYLDELYAWGIISSVDAYHINHLAGRTTMDLCVGMTFLLIMLYFSLSVQIDELHA